MSTPESPLPWRINHSFPTQILPSEDDTRKALIARTDCSHGLGNAGKTDIANAKLIVRAVNTHAAMVEALKQGIWRIERLNIGTEELGDDPTLVQMKEALRQAEEGLSPEDYCEVCGTTGSCQCCETCGAETHEECECCPRCHGAGQCALLSGIEWDYTGPDYGTCPQCGGSGKR